MKRRAFVRLLTGLAAAHAAKPPIRIPFESEDGRAIWLRVKVNGSPPERFLFDTGAAGTVVNWRRAAALGLKAHNEILQRNAGAGDAATRIGFLPETTYELAPELNLRLSESAAIPLDDVARSYGCPMDGIIGGDLTNRYVVEIDFDERVVVLHEPGAFRYVGSGAVIPIDVRRSHSYVRCTVSAGGAPPADGLFMIDSPVRDTVMFAAPFARAFHLRQLVPKLLPHIGVGVGGEFTSHLGRIDSLRIGPFTIPGPVAHFPEAQAGAFARTDIAGLIGAELLRRFRTTLDYSRSQLILEPNAHLHEPCPADASGILVRTAGTNYREYEIGLVAPASPAEEAGLAARDRIMSVNGDPASNLRLWDIRTVLREPGRKVAMEIQRGEERRNASLMLRRLL